MIRLEGYKRLVISSKNLEVITLRGNIERLKFKDSPRLYRVEVYGLIGRLGFQTCSRLSVIEYRSINKVFSLRVDDVSRTSIRLINVTLGLQQVKWVSGFSIFCGKEAIQTRIREWLSKELKCIWKIAQSDHVKS